MKREGKERGNYKKGKDSEKKKKRRWRKTEKYRKPVEINEKRRKGRKRKMNSV